MWYNFDCSISLTIETFMVILGFISVKDSVFRKIFRKAVA